MKTKDGLTTKGNQAWDTRGGRCTRHVAALLSLVWVLHVSFSLDRDRLVRHRSPVVGVVGGGGTKGPLPGVTPEVDPPVGPPMGPGEPAAAPGRGERRGGVCAAGCGSGEV